VGKKVPTAKSEIVDVHIKELDEEDCVVIHHNKKAKKKAKKRNQKSRIRLKKEPKPKVKQLTLTHMKDDES